MIKVGNTYLQQIKVGTNTPNNLKVGGTVVWPNSGSTGTNRTESTNQ